MEAGEFGSATLSSGQGGGSGGFDGFGDQIRVAGPNTRKMPPRKGLPPLGNLRVNRKVKTAPRDTWDDTLAKDMSMNYGGSGQGEA
jgi:hypothetical protein